MCGIRVLDIDSAICCWLSDLSPMQINSIEQFSIGNNEHSHGKHLEALRFLTSPKNHDFFHRTSSLPLCFYYPLSLSTFHFLLLFLRFVGGYNNFPLLAYSNQIRICTIPKWSPNVKRKTALFLRKIQSKSLNLAKRIQKWFRFESSRNTSKTFV